MSRRLVQMIFVSVPLWVSVGWAADEDLGPAAEFVGAERCGKCHKSAMEAWQKSAHRRAQQALSGKQVQDARCVRCHGVDVQKVAGVQCESCHGAGKTYARRYVMKDKELSRIVGLDPPSEKTCQRCHTESAPKIRASNFGEMLQRIAHGQDKPEPEPEPKSKSKSK
jgi:cytochrome c5